MGYTMMWSLFCSNLGFALLGRCLVSHFLPNTSYEEYIQQNILEPLGMRGTGFNHSHHR